MKTISRKIRRKLRSVVFWMRLTEDDVMSIFATLPEAKRVGIGDEQYVFVPGLRDDRVLIVSHADTVWKDKEKDINIGFDNRVFFSRNDKIGIGADDRAGCAITWRLRNLGHSILIPNREERGCKGSNFLMSNKESADEINKHQFAIQFDRRNNNDLVFYDVGSEPFTKWCEEQFVGYKKAYGSNTDIKVICRDMCGVNISTGYEAEHTPSEKLNLDAWNRTLETARKVLSKNGLPKFEKPKVQTYTSYHYPRTYHQEGSSYKLNKGLDTVYDTASFCSECGFLMDLSDIATINGQKICCGCGLILGTKHNDV